MASDKDLLDAMLQADEGINLDFKSRIDLDSSEGKAKFIKVLLALANSPIKPALMALGVEDKTKRVTGLQPDIGDERLQNIVHTYCRPPIVFSYRVAKHPDGDVGIISITGSRRPYRHSDKYLELLPKDQQKTLDRIVFIRHGSTTASADPEELMEMERERHNNNDTQDLQNIELEMADLSSSVGTLRWSLDALANSRARDRSIEYAFVGILSGFIFGYLQSTGFILTLLFAPLISTMLGVVASALRIVQFGLLRSIAVGIVVGIGYTVLYSLGTNAIGYITNIEPSVLTLLFMSGFAGGISGLLADVLIARLEN